MLGSTWHGRLLLALFGSIGGLALPPFHLVFFVIPGVVALVFSIISAARLSQAFGAGWWFGVGHGLVGYYWVANAFLVDAEAHGILAPFSVLGLAAALGIFPGLTVAITWGLCRYFSFPPIKMILSFAIIWGISEWLRAWVFTGFPWNLVATIWTFSPEVLQIAAIIGPYGLGILTMAVAGLPAIFLINGCKRRSAIYLSMGIITSVVIWASGYLRLESASNLAVNGVLLRLVQPNIPQHLKWQSRLRARHVQRQIRLSVLPKQNTAPTHVIWAETAVPFNLSADPIMRQMISAIVPHKGLLITGAPRIEISENIEPRLYNSIYALDEAGNIKASYDKQHLVPFGEYVPMPWLFRLSKLTDGRIDFHPGKTEPLVNLRGLPPAAMLICYEIIFPGKVIESQHRPAWILNLTNDAWFGISAGPYQHLAAAQLRAVEQGVPVIRVANTGISAVIDPYGRLKTSIPLGSEGLIDAELPRSLKKVPIYGKLGDKLTLLIVLVGLLVLWRPKLNKLVK